MRGPWWATISFFSVDYFNGKFFIINKYYFCFPFWKVKEDDEIRIRTKRG